MRAYEAKKADRHLHVPAGLLSVQSLSLSKRNGVAA
jgi:hypothetical protein